MLQHIEKSRTVTLIKENIEEEEKSLDDSDIYVGLDEYSNRITEILRDCDFAGLFGPYSHFPKLW